MSEAVTMHPRLSIHQVGFGAQSLDQFADACVRIGARQLTLVSPLLLADGAASIRATLAERGLRAVNVAHGFCATPLSDPAGRSAARDTLLRLIDEAAALGVGTVYMLTGGRGTLGWEEAADAFAEAVRPCVERGRAAGVAIAIENASGLYADIHIAHSLSDTIRLAEIADVALCIETYFGWPEAGLAELIRRAMPRCTLVQLSDYVPGDRSLPSRAVPGDGAIPLATLLRIIHDAGYTGPLDLELLGPRIDAEGAEAAYARAGAVVTDMLTTLRL
ncbi:sugar phosphate isomerase/epimerase [Sphingobium sufflavum]|uniref:sugar phosphate isomerase/epimerase family protein n=1 Tax=Sphingobium sufflavum TaxID=1129547 RepID=UPI001F20A29E|nr:sugar phosphate isomerase/epimerase [Sphingobium sufflavum]MCE7795462.1 sugar phosphate isomerase/epimerase [Sphingobium sufflavum]